MKSLTLEKITISAHAKKRYAERIMDKNEQMDIVQFAALHENKIREDIQKMLLYGELVYTGRSTNENNKKDTHVFVNGTWVVIVDVETMNVITLYSIDIGLDDDFTKKYVQEVVKKIKNAEQKIADCARKIEEQTETYDTLIKENEAVIKEYEKIIAALKEQNAGYKEVISGLQSQKDLSDKEIRDTVARLIGKKVF